MGNLIDQAEDKTREDFIEPYFIEQLGGEGLLAADIAKSLRISNNSVRQKLLKRDFIDRIKTQGFQAQTFVCVNENTGLEFEEIALDTKAAKFFVGKYDNDRGDAYLAFLLRLEQRVDELDAEIKGDTLLREIAHTMNLRRRQLIHEKRIQIQEEKTQKLESKTSELTEHLLDSQLTQPQKKRLKALIDAKANAYGSIKFAGCIQKELKAHFGLNETNDKFYHLDQRHYEAACRFVEDWGR